MILNSPMDGYKSSKYAQSFWWEDVDNARSYRLQVVSPSFDSIGALVLDTILKSNRFSFTFEPGDYQWRVRAENSGSETAYFTRSFSIFPSSISTRQVQLMSPTGNTVSNATELSLKWYALYGATRYQVEVDTLDFSVPAKLVYTGTTTGTDLTIPLNLERTYKWRLRAESDSLASKWSGPFTFTFDNTPPAKVTIVSPDDNASLTKPVELKWNAVSGAKKYKVAVYKNNSTSFYDATFPATVSGTSYTLSKGQTGETLQWQVRAIDEAGNEGEFSAKRTIVIQ
ncbi:MAG: hypothetical protein EOO01_36465 [Chitinophagaceae bacterium]|nr:MAG: hypothetical protein EOO01_36465 [Chitinophagaceae bacterium]